MFFILAWFLCIPCTALLFMLQGLCGSPMGVFRGFVLGPSWSRLGAAFLLCYASRFATSPCLSLRVAVLLGYVIACRCSLLVFVLRSLCCFCFPASFF